MHTARILILLLLLPAVYQAAEETDPTAGDDKLLADHGIARDGPGLLRFLRLRSPGPEDRRVIARHLADLGSDAFDEREAATQQLILRGAAVIEDLKKLRSDPDAEVRRRALQALQEIEGGPGSALPTAAVRRLAVLAPPGTVRAVLHYLPFAEDELVEEEIVLALDRLTRNRPVEPDLLTALADTAPVVRGVAGQVVAKIGTADQRNAVRALLKDSEPRVRFRVALGLIAGNQREGVPVLIELLTQEHQQVCWQAEEVLYRLAGEKGPGGTSGLLNPEDRRKARTAWEIWWRDNGAGIDLTVLSDTRQLGFTLGIEFNTGRVWESAPDRSLRFEIKNLQGPMEAQLLPGGRVLVAESNSRQVTERDLKGNILWTLSLEGNEPTGCQRLPNGNTFVSSYSKVMEYNREGKLVYQFALPQGANAIRKHRNGHVIYATDETIVELDTTGQLVRKIPLPRESMYVGIRDLPGDRFLVANSNSGRVIEVDRTGKVLWESKVAGACGVERTAAGHTLVATSGRVVELDRVGAIVWELKTAGYVRRVHRR